MKIKDFSCYFNMPKQLKSKKNKQGDELSHDLPPYATQAAMVVDEYPACPTSWMHGSSIANSYFVEVKPGYGMWIDFNENHNSEYDVAIVLSIQGINPITGQKMVGENLLRLEQYKTKCPIHNIDFQQDRFCPECGFKWPAQNYICTTGTPSGMLWIDGFRTPEGKTRQYIFTEEEMRGVAAQLIGDERVFAIGIAFYRSKQKKSNRYQNDILRGGLISPFYSPMHTPTHWDYGLKRYTSSVDNSSSPVNMTLCSCNQNLNVDDCSIEIGCFEAQSIQEVTPVKKIEIGAGALINQNIHDDPQDIDYWEDKPSGMIYINYCDSETVKRIIKAGKRVDKKNGFMENIQVGV